MSLSPTSLPLTDTSSPLQWHSGHLNWPGSLCIHSLIGLSPAVTRELVARIFKLKPLCMLSHTPFVTPLNISEVRSQREQFITFLLRSCNHWSPFTFCLHSSFCFLPILNFLAIFIVWGFQGHVFRFIIAFAPPLSSFNINDSLILCNKATVMNWQIKMAAY